MRQFTPQKISKIKKTLQAVADDIQSLFDAPEMTRLEAEGDVGTLMILIQGRIEDAIGYIDEAAE